MTGTSTHTSRVLTRLDGVRAQGEDQWQALCPAHADRTPSLSVRSKGDKVLVYCHAGCDISAVLAKIGLTTSDLFEGGSASSSSVGVLRHHEYSSATGEVLFAVQRLDRAQQRFRTVHLAEGEWVKGRGSHPPMLYRLPEVLAADPGETVWTTEGERDADSLWSLGMVATTVPSGSWNKADLSPLVGRDVVVCCDADGPGIKQGRRRAEALRAAGVLVPDDSIVFPDVPGDRPDITDAVEWARENAPVPDDCHRCSTLACALVEIEAWKDERTIAHRLRPAWVPSEVLLLGADSMSVYAVLSGLAAGSGTAKACINEVAAFFGWGPNRAGDAFGVLEKSGWICSLRRGWWGVQDRPLS